MLLKNPNEIKPYPISVYFIILLLLTICGILVSVYLAVSHYRVYTDIKYSSFCAVSKAINCDTVSQSPYSIFLDVPVPIWGIIGYIFFLLTLLVSYHNRSQKLSAFMTYIFITAIFSFISIFLGILSAVKIHSYCIMCIVTYGINFMLLYTTWLTRKRFARDTWLASIKIDFKFWLLNKKQILKFFTPLALFVLSIILFLPHYWLIVPTKTPNPIIKMGVTEDGSPWIGADNPELTIIEYTDYMCFQCKKMHFFLRSLVDTHPDKIRIIHKHFPMDKKYNSALQENIHPGSGILSSIAIFATQKDKFWQLNDYLYNYNMGNKAIYLRKIAKDNSLNLNELKTGIHSRKVKIKLQRDIVYGLKKKITGTPTYVIDEKIYTGQIPADILKTFTK